MTNQVLEVIKSRSSIRAFKSQSLTSEQLTALKDAALASPSAMNRQPYRFIFINNKTVLQEIEQDVVNHFQKKDDKATIERLQSRNNKVLYDAPCLIAIAIEDANPFAKVDAGIAVQSIALAAKSIGLDSCIVGMPGIAFGGEKADYWKAKLNIPDGYGYGIGILVGHADMEKAPHEPDPSKVHIIE